MSEKPAPAYHRSPFAGALNTEVLGAGREPPGAWVETADTIFYPGGGGPVYTASKHALVGLVRQLAHELAPKVRVNGVAPGGMKTGLSGLTANGTAGQSLNQIDTLDEMLVGITPLRISPKPEQYCAPYVLLASKENSAPTTGAIINTDGGLGARGIVNVNGGESL